MLEKQPYCLALIICFQMEPTVLITLGLLHFALMACL